MCENHINPSFRFRQEGDEDADPVVLSTEDELDVDDPNVQEDPFAAALVLHYRNLMLRDQQNPVQQNRHIPSGESLAHTEKHATKVFLW